MSGELEALYPFLHGKQHDPAALDSVLVHSVEEKARDSRETNARFFAAEADILVAAAKALAAVYRRGGRMFAMGNGGSSCDASHVAVEFVHPDHRRTTGACGHQSGRRSGDDLRGRQRCRFRARLRSPADRPGQGRRCPDRHFHQRQFVEPDRRLRQGQGYGTGHHRPRRRRRRQDEVGRRVDHCLVVPTTSIHRIQECHVAAYHILWDLVHTLLADDRGSATTKGAAA